MRARERTPRVPHSFGNDDLLVMSGRDSNLNNKFSDANTYQLVRPKTQLKGTGIRIELAEKRKIVDNIVGKHESVR